MIPTMTRSVFFPYTHENERPSKTSCVKSKKNGTKKQRNEMVS